MGRRYFGTDGIRGRVGDAPITPELMLRLGFAAGEVLALAGGSSRRSRPAVLIGKDTRVSGYMIEAALEAGLSAAGVDVMLCGPMPTPAVAYLTRALRLSAGIVISASHNPYEDNGVKFFDGGGGKLDDSIEARIEDALERPLACRAPAALGKARRLDDAAGRYIEFCKSTFPARLDLKGLRIVVDCAHGAAYHVAPPVFHELGAEVIALANRPDGFNINRDCGATHPAALAAAVREHEAVLGIALDGDGDRLVMVDAAGRIYDGDELLYVIAMQRQRAGALGGGVVGTLMTNYGLEQALERAGIAFARAAVGDRYVLELLHARGWSLGGENSGHIVCLDRHTTGDGVVSALQVLTAVVESGRALPELLAGLAMLPQVMINVRTGHAGGYRPSAAVRAALESAERELAGRGRVLLRPSGTEPVVRVMVEGYPESLSRGVAERLSDVVRSDLND
jgi:phosphoglucosamine mutase